MEEKRGKRRSVSFHMWSDKWRGSLTMEERLEWM
jgi:hypothetical protein